MNDDYLWKKTGAPDPEVQRFEQLLGQYRFPPDLIEIPAQLRHTFERRNPVPTFSEVNSESLPTRLAAAARQNLIDFKNDSASFLRALFSVSEIEKRRVALLRWCLLSTCVMHVIAYGGVLLLPHGFFGPTPAILQEKTELAMITMIEPVSIPPINKAGGGGGGNSEKTPASKGRLPEASLATPPIVAPSTHQNIQNPSLPVTPAVQMDPDLFPKQDNSSPLGDPKGVPGAPSDGPGLGGGIGSGQTGGIGAGVGGGAGQGQGGGIGAGNGGGLGGGEGQEFLRPIILFQVKPKYTEEARQNKIQGRVVLSVEFKGDGTIGEVRVVKSLGFGLDESAIDAARQIRFRPPIRGGVPVTTRARVEFTFNLI